MTRYLIDATCYRFARTRGIGQYVHQLALAFDRAPHLIDPDEELVVAVRQRGAGAISADLDLDRQVGDEVERVETFRRDRWLHFDRTLRRAGADVVHFAEGPQVRRLRGPASVVTCHDLVPLIFPHEYMGKLRHSLPRRLGDYLAYTGASRIIAISQCTADLLHEMMAIPRARISVVHHGVDHERFHPRPTAGEREVIAERYGLPARYVVYVGYVDPRKRVDLLIHAYRQVFRATGVPLALVGSAFDAPDGKLAAAIRAAAPGSVLPIGEVRAEHLAAVYRHADVHALPSIYEGFGFTVLEAMASGCPVVCTEGGALPEVGGDAVRYVERDRAGDLEVALVDLLRDRAARDRLRERGLARAAGFTWERAVRQTLDVYRRAAGRPTTAAASSSRDRVAAEVAAPAQSAS